MKGLSLVYISYNNTKCVQATILAQDPGLVLWNSRSNQQVQGHWGIFFTVACNCSHLVKRFRILGIFYCFCRFGTILFFPVSAPFCAVKGSETTQPINSALYKVKVHISIFRISILLIDPPNGSGSRARSRFPKIFTLWFISLTLIIRSSCLIHQSVGLDQGFFSISNSEVLRQIYEDVMAPKLKFWPRFCSQFILLLTNQNKVYCTFKNFIWATFHLHITKEYIMSGAHYVTKSSKSLFV